MALTVIERAVRAGEVAALVRSTERTIAALQGAIALGARFKSMTAVVLATVLDEAGQPRVQDDGATVTSQMSLAAEMPGLMSVAASAAILQEVASGYQTELDALNAELAKLVG